jgi:hypothetical protein
MTETGPWTIGELSDLVLRALHAGGPVGAGGAAQPSKRVRAIPDERTIRWYSSIGLLDKPAIMRGRTALYDRRHLCQLVAVKRLQAQGRSLAQVQEDLLGATDATLERIAQIPADLLNPALTSPGLAPRLDQSGAAPRRAERFWAVGASDVVGVGDGDVDSADADADGAEAADADTVGFGEAWQVAVGAVGGDGVGVGEVVGVGVVPAVRLGAGVTLLLGAATRPLNGEDLARLEEAAAPLLALLRGRGLDGPDPGRNTR